MISLLIGSSPVFQAQAYSDEGCRCKRAGKSAWVRNGRHASRAPIAWSL